jgi:capsular exopolysaccharide synthesis family protein
MAINGETERGPTREREAELSRYLRILTERRWAVVMAVVVGMVVFALWGVRQPRVYQAAATIVVEAAPPQYFGSEQVRDVVQVGPGQYYAMQDYIQTQRRVLTSDTLARRVVQRLDLEKDRDFWGDGLPSSQEAAVQAFAGAVSADPVLDTQVVVVSFKHHVPAQAKRAVDGLVDTYIESNLELRDNSNLSASHWLADEADQLRGRLSEAELALYDFKKKNELLSVSLEERINNVSRQIDKLSDALTEARLRKVSRSTEAEEMGRIVGVDPFSYVPPGGSASTGDNVSTLKKELESEQRKLSELRARYEDQHPLVSQEMAKVASVQAAIAREVASQLRAAQARTNEAAEEEKRIAAQLETAKQEGLRVTRLEIEYNKLKREADALGKQYLLVQGRTKETELASKLKVNNLHVLDYARLPSTAISPHLVRAGMISFVLSLIAGLLLALILDTLDRSLKSQEDVENKLAVPFLGVMPHVGDTTDGRLDLTVADNPQSPMAECCRLVRTNLLFAALSRPLRRLLITSPVAREGKTMTSISLGVVMAQAGSRVLLIDSDLRRPRLKTALQMDGDVGLTSVLLGTVSLDDAIRTTNIPNLFVLLSGPVPPNPAELVDGPRYREVLDECAEKFERVIIDSPPAVPVTDPAILATYCDGVVMVVRAGRTGQDQAERARRNLADVGARILGVVLNDADITSRGYGGYRYGYGYYSSQPQGKSSRGKSSRRAEASGRKRA